LPVEDRLHHPYTESLGLLELNLGWHDEFLAVSQHIDDGGAIVGKSGRDGRLQLTRGLPPVPRGCQSSNQKIARPLDFSSGVMPGGSSAAIAAGSVQYSMAKQSLENARDAGAANEDLPCGVRGTETPWSILTTSFSDD
jgi:hypothetical protein